MTLCLAMASNWKNGAQKASTSGGVTPLKLRWTNNGLFAGTVLTLSVAAIAGQGQPKAVTVKGGESGLVGIKLYDSGTRVISLFGNPNEIQAVSFSGGSIGPGGGGNAGGGGRPGAGPGPGGLAPGGGASQAGDSFNAPGGFGFGDELLRLQRGGRGGPDQGDDMGGGPPTGPQGGPGNGGPSIGGGGGRNMGGNAGSGSKILYTRWVYKRGPAKYGFILDKFNHVVQVEAIGMNDPKVRTAKGVKFGSTFGDVMNKYQNPDGYEINGGQIVVRYLVRNKVAFRLSQLGEKKPYVVTGIVVAGGKT